MISLPDGFFARADESPDGHFYAVDRFVTHIDDAAIAAVGALYAELGIAGNVLDLMSSWISHFETVPTRLTVLGLNGDELAGNVAATARVVHDLNDEPGLPFDDDSFDDAVCCVSVDYLTRPFEVFADVHRVVCPGGRFVCTFSNRCFPTKAIRGWLALDDRGRMDLVSAYFAETGWSDVRAQVRIPAGRTDPLYAVWGTAG